MFRALSILIVLILGIAPACADLYALTDRLHGPAGQTWYDLAKTIVTDLEMVDDGARARGTAVVPVRHLVRDYGGPAPATIEIEEVYGLSLLSDGRELTLALFDLGRSEDRPEATVVAAVFDEQLRLVDAADIAMDRVVGVETLPFRISNGDDAIVFYSRQGNSPPFSTSYQLVFFRDGRLQLIDWFATLDGRGCGWDGYQAIHFEAVPAERPGFWPIRVRIDDKLVVDETIDCERNWYESYEKSQSVLYRWDNSKDEYVAENDDLRRLMQITGDRY